jgi:hypothetical protein
MFYKVRKQFGYIQILKLKNAFSARLVMQNCLVAKKDYSNFAEKSVNKVLF